METSQFGGVELLPRASVEGDIASLDRPSWSEAALEEDEELGFGDIKL